MRPVPTMYSSKQTPQVRPPSLLYTSPERMKFIEKHDKDSAANFDNSLFRKEKGPTNNTKGKGATDKEKGQPERMCM